jgi:hypothetical protein
LKYGILLFLFFLPSEGSSQLCLSGGCLTTTFFIIKTHVTAKTPTAENSYWTQFFDWFPRTLLNNKMSSFALWLEHLKDFDLTTIGNVINLHC